MNRKPIFDAVRKMLGRSFTQAEVNALDKAIDLATGGLTASLPPEPAAPSPPSSPGVSGRTLGAAGSKLIKKWEGCARRLADGTFAAYPDPGSADGKPWTIGWGSTGPDVKKGVIWTQAQCDARFDIDMVDYVKEVAAFIGTAPTSQNQFDALVSFHYNTGKIASSTLGKRHKEGKFPAAQAEFGKWIYNDGKPMNGLKNRRADEAKLYAAP
ncbi:lysozyme [Novosphingobium guangzhouense]|uniref:Lysozyme n=1 Tax=Novosphingobium guangzhouense TaxID=1850347 RepID=A0A2K2FTR0_9SPHN|nr:lysozyme [Novosphingobium guangzhouense]PNU02171.1 glycoside hydrolase [Novosphingobium guangzhouense]